MRVEYGDGFAHIAVDKVYVDGKQVNHFRMVDTELGAVVCLKTNAEGEIQHIRGNLCMTELNGAVKITFKQCWSMNEHGDYVFKRGSIHNVYKRKSL